MFRVSAVLLVSLLTIPAFAAERAGVTMPDRLVIDGTQLELNGMGVREATIFKVDVYVAALYVEHRATSADEIIRSEQLKRLDMVLLRDVDRDDIVDAWRKGFKQNGADMTKLGPRIAQFAAWITDLKKKDTLSFVYRPSVGVTVALRGRTMGTIPGQDFASSFFAIWLGPKPADDALKTQLLRR